MAFIPRLFFLTIVILLIVVLIKANIKTEIDVFDAHADVFFQRLIYGRNAFSYNDEKTNRAYPGIIDLEKFRNQDLSFLNDALYYGDENRETGAKISLKDFDGNIDEEIIYNRKFFIEKETLLKAGGFTRGVGGVRGKTQRVYVLIKDKDKLTEGILNATIIIQNR